ncbi:hypothetical protein AOC36_04865 [Erysipelothrix larvae]|uniref:Asp23/Gls24 family envelope stress response protein n=1 Tax=Erysipelothrix larvae TaxID=1514105 RepID=A0A0X8GZX8_9FIRM|nr:hypothetical protein [Erysipelothrix larvae]AMC93329.1 hypothetical protein AOC36_04865 [Erysipelothrix larvae]
MSDYLVIQGVDTGLGSVKVSNTVVDSIVRQVIDESTSVFLDETRTIKAAPILNIAEDALQIVLKVRVKYGEDVEHSCTDLQKNLTEALELMLDYRNPDIIINVVGFRFS